MLRKSDIPDEVNVWHEEEIDDLREKNSTNRDFSRYIKYLESNYFDEYKDEARYHDWFGLISASIWYFIFASSLIFIYHCISVVYIPFSHVTIIPTYHEIQGVEQPLEDPSTTYFFSKFEMFFLNT